MRRIFNAHLSHTIDLLARRQRSDRGRRALVPRGGGEVMATDVRAVEPAHPRLRDAVLPRAHPAVPTQSFDCFRICKKPRHRLRGTGRRGAAASGQRCADLARWATCSATQNPHLSALPRSGPSSSSTLRAVMPHSARKSYRAAGGFGWALDHSLSWASNSSTTRGDGVTGSRAQSLPASDSWRPQLWIWRPVCETISCSQGRFERWRPAASILGGHPLEMNS
jgi:hypothetical protein